MKMSSIWVLVAGAFLLQACGPVEAGGSEDELRDLSQTSVTLVDYGEGWQRLHVRTSTVVGDRRVPLDEMIIVAQGANALRQSPVPSTVTTELTQPVLASDSSSPSSDRTFVVSAKQAEAFIARKNTPLGEQAQGGIGVARQPLCKTVREVKALTKRFDLLKKEAADNAGTSRGDLRARANVRTSVNASIEAELHYELDTACGVPLGVAVRGVSLRGDLSADLHVGLESNFEKETHLEERLASLDVGRLTFMAGPIPIVLGANVVVTAGIDASARANASVKTDLRASAELDLYCPRVGSCESKHRAKVDPGAATQDGLVKLEGQGRATVEPWLRASLRSFLYSEKVDAIEVALRAGLRGEAWSYAGTTCGDRNGDGSPEPVSAAALDVTAPITLQVSTELLQKVRWTRTWLLGEPHVYFHEFAPSSALAPIFHRRGEAAKTETWAVGSGDCWPYAQELTFVIDWGEGSTETIRALPKTVLSVSRSFATAPHAIPKVVELRDASGRVFR